MKKSRSRLLACFVLVAIFTISTMGVLANNLLTAVEDDDLGAIQALIEGGADVNARHEIGCWTILIHAIGWNSNPEVVKILIEAGANVNAKNEFGVTALMYVAKYSNNPEVIRLLLNAGADGALKSFENKTAFDYAKENPNIKDTEVYWLLNDARF